MVQAVTTNSKTFLSPPPNPIPMSHHFPFSPPASPRQPPVYILTLDLPVLDISCKGNRAVCCLLWLVSFTWRNVFKGHPSCSMYSTSFLPLLSHINNSGRLVKKNRENSLKATNIIILWFLFGSCLGADGRSIVGIWKYCRLRNFFIYLDMVIKKLTGGCFVSHMVIFVAFIEFTTKEFNSFVSFLPKWTCEQVPT